MPSSDHDARPSDLRVNHPAVVAQDFDGERVIVHLGTGIYYALDERGSAVWSALELGADRATVCADLARDSQQSGSEAACTLDAFLAELSAEDLIVTGETINSPDIPPTQPIELRRFSDLADVLLVDPIHDLDLDGDGWPVDAGGGVGRPRPDAHD